MINLQKGNGVFEFSKAPFAIFKVSKPSKDND